MMEDVIVALAKAGVAGVAILWICCSFWTVIRLGRILKELKQLNKVAYAMYKAMAEQE